MSIFTLGVLFLAGLLSAYGQNPWEPVPRNEDWWIARHEEFVQNTIDNPDNIDIVFLGSSSIANWGSTGQDIWDEKYGPLKAVNYGIGGDKIENCLWRIMNQEVDGLNPKLFVLYCGSNNIRHPIPDDVFRGVRVTLEDLAQRLPNTTVLYVNFFPRTDVTPPGETFEKILAINNQTSAMHNGQNLFVFDMFSDLILDWGELNMEYYQSDQLHLNQVGYGLWDRLWNSTFFDALG